MTLVTTLMFIVLVSVGSILMARDVADALGLLCWTMGVFVGVAGLIR